MPCERRSALPQGRPGGLSTEGLVRGWGACGLCELWGILLWASCASELHNRGLFAELPLERGQLNEGLCVCFAAFTSPCSHIVTTRGVAWEGVKGGVVTRQSGRQQGAGSCPSDKGHGGDPPRLRPGGCTGHQGPAGARLTDRVPPNAPPACVEERRDKQEWREPGRQI